METKQLNPEFKNPIASFVNCTPHDITVKTVDDTFEVYPRSGIVPRLDRELCYSRTFNDVEVCGYAFGEETLTDMPDESKYAPETIFIVSAQVAQYLGLSGRGFRFVSPGELIRNDAGQPVACDGFIHHGIRKSNVVCLHDHFCAMNINKWVK